MRDLQSIGIVLMHVGSTDCKLILPKPPQQGWLVDSTWKSLLYWIHEWWQLWIVSMHLFWMDGFNNGKTAASYIVFEPDQTEEDELSSMSSSASELTETPNSKLLLVTSSTCFGHVGLNSCHEGIDSPLSCNITKINVNHGSWIDHNWHISRGHFPRVCSLLMGHDSKKQGNPKRKEVTQASLTTCTQLNKHTHTQSHTHINTKLTHWMLFVCLDSLRFLVLKPSSLHLPISKDDEVINYYEIHHTTHTAQSQQLHPRNWDSYNHRL